MMHDPTHPFARYFNIIDDWSQFTQTLEQPLPRSLWVNPLKIIAPEIKKSLSQNWQSLPLANAYTSKQDNAGTHWAYHAGLYHLQELVSMLPVLLLDPKPGERILDLCAAPGSKTVQMALAMKNQGTIIANDKNYSRSKALRHHLERLGIVNVTTTTFDGASFPNSAGVFDKVLVDAPCSGEGTSRKHCSAWKTQKNVHNVHQLQLRILRRAIALCKPGGLILYSTCTYAPEENENVVNSALQMYPELSLLPFFIAGLKLTRGLTHWQDQTFAPELVHTARLWPHHNNTGGFYLALIRKNHTNDQHENNNQPYSIDRVSNANLELKQYLKFFAFPENLFDQYHAFTVPKHGIYIVSQDHQTIDYPKPDAVGLYILKTRMEHPKLTTAAARLFGHLAQQQFVELNEMQLQLYFQRADQSIAKEKITHCPNMGYVIVRYQGFGIGVGLLLNSINDQEYRLRSLYPKS